MSDEGSVLTFGFADRVPIIFQCAYLTFFRLRLVTAK